MVYGRINFDTKANPLTLEGVKALMVRMDMSNAFGGIFKDIL